MLPHLKFDEIAMQFAKHGAKSLKIHKIRSDVISDNLVELENMDFD